MSLLRGNTAVGIDYCNGALLFIAAKLGGESPSRSIVSMSERLFF